MLLDLPFRETKRRLIGDFTAANGVPFDEIGILLRSSERHQPLVVEALRRAGIPHYCELGSVRPDVAGRSFLALLYCKSKGDRGRCPILHRLDDSILRRK